MSEKSQNQELLAQVQRVSQAFAQHDQKYHLQEQKLQEEVAELRAALNRARAEAASRDEVDLTTRDSERGTAKIHLQQILAHELELQEDIDTLRETVVHIELETAQREHALSTLAQQALDKTQTVALDYLNNLAERELRFTEQLARERHEAQRAMAEQTRIHGEREQSLNSELVALRTSLSDARKEASDRERDLGKLADRALDAARIEANARIRELVERERHFSEKLAQVQQESRQAIEDLTQSHSDREQMLNAELADLRTTLSNARSESTERERALGEVAERALAAAQAESGERMRELVERERRFAEKLDHAQNEAQRSISEQGQAHAKREHALSAEITVLRMEITKAAIEAHELERRIRAEADRALDSARKESEERIREVIEREQALSAEICALQSAFTNARNEAAERERNFRADAEQALNSARAEADKNMREIVELERRFTDTLEKAHQEADTKIAELAHLHAEREQHLSDQLTQAQREARRIMTEHEQALVKRERQLREGADQEIKAARTEVSKRMRELVDRERRFAEQLAQVQHEAQWKSAEQARHHDERAQTLCNEIAALKTALTDAQIDAAKRERSLHDAMDQIVESAQTETITRLQELLVRERHFAEHLAQVQQEAHGKLLEQAQTHAALEQALSAEIAALRAAFTDAKHEAEDRERHLNATLLVQSEAHQALLVQIGKLDQQVDAAKAKEDEHRTDMAHQLEHTEILAKVVTQMQQTYSWRLTAPIRHLGRLLRFDGNHISGQSSAGQTIADTPSNCLPTSTVHQNPAAETTSVELPRVMSLSTPIVESPIDSPILKPESAMSTIQNIHHILLLEDAAFVEAAYKAVLGREPDPVGMRYYQDRLHAGYGKSSIIFQLATSAEGRKFKSELPGLRELVATNKRASHWIWKILLRGNRIERQVARLEQQMGRLALHLTKLRIESPVSAARLDKAMSALQAGIPDTRAHDQVVDMEVPRPVQSFQGQDVSRLSVPARQILTRLVQASAARRTA